MNSFLFLFLFIGSHFLVAEVYIIFYLFPQGKGKGGELLSASIFMVEAGFIQARQKPEYLSSLSFFFNGSSN